MTEQQAKQRETAREARRILRAQDLGPPTGTRDRYECYVVAAVELGHKHVKTFDEWLNS